MLRKYLFAAVIASSALFCTDIVADTVPMQQDATTTELVCDNGQSASVNGDWVDSKEVNTVQESEIARKMKQAEKARNAAENDSFGGAITIIAMTIVISALIILSLLFLGFGKISSWMLKKRKKESHGVDENSAEDHHNELDSGETIAAIGMALAEHFGQTHDMEEAILIIKRMKKAYSPWNSKIYNMRNIPTISHHKDNLKK